MRLIINFLNDNYKMPSIGVQQRQIPLATTYYSLPTDFRSLYVFKPTSDNYVGNYTPGFMDRVDNDDNLVLWIATQQIYFNETLPNRTQFVMRDMGKTIRARFTNSQNPNDEQYFRQVQILKPGEFPVPPPTNSFEGGSSGIVGGSVVPTAESKYATFYIPVGIMGLTMSAPGVYPIAGGQM